MLDNSPLTAGAVGPQVDRYHDVAVLSGVGSWARSQIP
jgi:hypothetical protein